MQGPIGARARLTAIAAAGALAAAALGVVSATPANAAVMVSGSTIDWAGNYVDGTITVFTSAGAEVGSYDTQAGTFDIPLNDGGYKLEFSNSDFGNEFTPEYFRDKPDLATADVVTVAGAAQTLSPWTIDRRPSVVGTVRTADGRVVRSGYVEARDAATGDYVGQAQVETSGTFRVVTTSPSVKLRISGSDPSTGKSLAAEWFNDKATFATADAVAPTGAGADVGVVALAPAGSISGRVTTEAGAPLQRVKACVNDSDFQCDFTDASGLYTIEGAPTGDNTVSFTDPIGEYVGEYWNNVPLTSVTPANPVTVAPGQAVGGIDAALAAAPAATPTGVDVSGTVRDELGNLGVGYEIRLWDTPADPRNATAIASTYSNRAGQYHFSQLDRVPGETEFKIQVVGEGPREDGDFSRRTTWSGDKHGYNTAAVVTAAPRTLDFVLPVAGGVSGAVTSEAGGRPDGASVTFFDSAKNSSFADEILGDGSYDQRSLWAGTYTVRFSALDHVTEWWKDATPDEAVTITVKPGQVVTGISAALGKEVKAVERPEVKGGAWVGKTVRLDAGAWNTEATSRFTYEWLVGTTVVATGPSLKVTRSMLGKKLTGRVTNDAGFAQGQALTRATPKVGFKPKLSAKVKGKKIALTLKAKPLKAKKVKATVVVYENLGKKANGEIKLKKVGKGKIVKGVGTATLTKSLGKGKHKLVFRIKGKGKVGSGDIQKKVKLKR